MGDFEAATDTAQSIKNRWVRGPALIPIATAQVQSGDKAGAHLTLAAALDLAQSIKEIYRRTIALKDIATTQAQMGDIAGARRTLAAALDVAQSIESDQFRASALRNIAVVQAQTGDFEAALRIAQSMDDLDYLAARLPDIIEAGLTDQDRERAVFLAETMQFDRNVWLPPIAEAFMKTGDLPNFKRLLIPCAYYLDAAYRMCGLLARAYPDQASAIAKVVMESAQQVEPQSGS